MKKVTDYRASVLFPPVLGHLTKQLQPPAALSANSPKFTAVHSYYQELANLSFLRCVASPRDAKIIPPSVKKGSGEADNTSWELGVNLPCSQRNSRITPSSISCSFCSGLLLICRNSLYTPSSLVILCSPSSSASLPFKQTQTHARAHTHTNCLQNIAFLKQNTHQIAWHK